MWQTSLTSTPTSHPSTLLAAAAGADADTRNKAVRLLCNQLFPDPLLTHAIRTFASDALAQLLQPPADDASEAAADEEGERPSRQWTQEEALRWETTQMVVILPPAYQHLKDAEVGDHLSCLLHLLNISVIMRITL